MNTPALADYIAAIDIGTTKICVLIGRILPHGAVDIVGIGKHPSYGLKKGIIINMSATVESLKRALKEAQMEAGVVVTKAVVGISGSHIKSFNATGVVGISRPDVTQYDIDRVIEVAKAIPIPQDREILHILPQYFRVDGQEHVQDSLGMHGVRLEAHVHIVTGAISSAQNIVKAVELAGVSVLDIVLEQLASAHAVLTPSEQELGVGILDIGGGTADFAIYKDGRIRYSKVFPIAGNHFTNDLAIGLSIPIAQAEELKKKYGCVTEQAFAEMGAAHTTISLDYEGGHKEVDLYRVYEILQPRAAEIFAFVREEIEANRLMHLMPSGFVLTGGGSLLRGLRQLVQAELLMPVRVGGPRYYFMPSEDTAGVPEALRSPLYATAYGLLAFGLPDVKVFWQSASQVPLMSRVLQRMKTWIYDFL
jgi:cell division protein FtsA